MASLAPRFSNLVVTILFCTVVLGQGLDDAISTTIPECLKLDNHFFCNPGNVSTNPNRPLSEGFGWCCPQGSTSSNCQAGVDGLVCTSGDKEVQGEQLYKTFWVGMTPAICNSESNELIATKEAQRQVTTNMLIESRVATTYEACHWVISVPDYKYRDDT